MPRTPVKAASEARRAVADEIRAEMARRRLSTRQLAEAVGMNRFTLERRLNARYSFTYDELVAIADHFGITVLDLLTNAERRAA